MTTRWYATLESVKAAGAGTAGAELDALLGSYIAGATTKIEKELGRHFIPETATRYFAGNGSDRIWIPDLLAVTSIKLDEDGDRTYELTLAAATDYRLKRAHYENEDALPKTQLRLDTVNGQRTSFLCQENLIEIAGARWGYSEDTEPAGALAEADDGSETELDVTDSSLIGVGDTILVGTEAMFVSMKSLLDTTANTAGALNADASQKTVPVNDGTLVKKNEIITIDAERMLVEDIAANNLIVKRAYDGTTLATHGNPSDVYAPRRLTVARAINGTTGATHSSGQAVLRYAPPADIVDLCRAEAIAHLQQGRSGWTGQIGGSEGTVETRMFNLWSMWKEARLRYWRGA